MSMQDFLHERDLDTFEKWLEYQGVDANSQSDTEIATWRELFEELRATKESIPKMGSMKLPPLDGDYRYAIAVREDDNLLLALWIRRSKDGDVIVLIPRSDGSWNPHTSYHHSGRLHQKGHGVVMGQPKQCQPLTGVFQGNENIGSFGGYGPIAVGAVCDPHAFSKVIEVPENVLGPRHGIVVVDLVEPGHDPIFWPFANLVRQEIFTDAIPWLVVRIGY